VSTIQAELTSPEGHAHVGTRGLALGSGGPAKQGGVERWAQVHQTDEKTTFLSGVTEQEVYVMQRKGFERAGAEHKGCKLGNGLYGLRQARASSSHTLCSARTLSTRLATSPSRHATTIASPEKKPWRCARRHTQTRAP
jgi:hypothetical protein